MKCDLREREMCIASFSFACYIRGSDRFGVILRDHYHFETVNPSVNDSCVQNSCNLSVSLSGVYSLVSVAPAAPFCRGDLQSPLDIDGLQNRVPTEPRDKKTGNEFICVLNWLTTKHTSKLSSFFLCLPQPRLTIVHGVGRVFGACLFTCGRRAQSRPSLTSVLCCLKLFLSVAVFP